MPICQPSSDVALRLPSNAPKIDMLDILLKKVRLGDGQIAKIFERYNRERRTAFRKVRASIHKKNVVSANDPSIWADREEQVYSATLNVEQMRSACVNAVPGDAPTSECVWAAVSRLGSSAVDSKRVRGVAGSLDAVLEDVTNTSASCSRIQGSTRPTVDVQDLVENKCDATQDVNVIKPVAGSQATTNNCANWVRASASSLEHTRHQGHVKDTRTVSPAYQLLHLSYSLDDTPPASDASTIGDIVADLEAAAFDSFGVIDEAHLLFSGGDTSDNLSAICDVAIAEGDLVYDEEVHADGCKVGIVGCVEVDNDTADCSSEGNGYDDGAKGVEKDDSDGYESEHDDEDDEYVEVEVKERLTKKVHRRAEASNEGPVYSSQTATADARAKVKAEWEEALAAKDLNHLKGPRLRSTQKTTKVLTDPRGRGDRHSIPKDKMPAAKWTDCPQIPTVEKLDSNGYVPCPIEGCAWAFKPKKCAIMNHLIGLHYEQFPYELDHLALPKTGEYAYRLQRQVHCIFKELFPTQRCEVTTHAVDSYGRHLLSIHLPKAANYRCRICHSQFFARDTDAAMRHANQCTGSSTGTDGLKSLKRKQVDEPSPGPSSSSARPKRQCVRNSK